MYTSTPQSSRPSPPLAPPLHADSCVKLPKGPDRVQAAAAAAPALLAYSALHYGARLAAGESVLICNGYVRVWRLACLAACPAHTLMPMAPLRQRYRSARLPLATLQRSSRIHGVQRSVGCYVLNKAFPVASRAPSSRRLSVSGLCDGIHNCGSHVLEKLAGGITDN